MLGSRQSLSGSPPCLQPLLSIQDTFAGLMILKNNFHPKTWNNYNALYVPTLHKTLYCLFFLAHTHKLKHKCCDFPFRDKKVEETEKVGDLPEVTQPVGGKARILPPAPMLFPPHEADFWKMTATADWPRSSYPDNFKILRLSDFSLIFLSSKTNLYPLRSDSVDSTTGPYPRPQYSQLQNGANYTSTKREHGIEEKGRRPGIRKNRLQIHLGVFFTCKMNVVIPPWWSCHMDGMRPCF